MQQSSSEAPRRLVVMRHAKAEPTAPSDHGRALASRGRRDAEAVGRWLSGQGITPDAALVSASLRTHQTWEHVASAAGWEVSVDFSGALYAAGPDSTFDLIREVDAGVRTLLVIGHNPTMASIAELIDDGEGDPDAATALVTRGLPTSGLAVFSVVGAWTDIGPGTGRIEAFHVGDA